MWQVDVPQIIAIRDVIGRSSQGKWNPLTSAPSTPGRRKWGKKWLKTDFTELLSRTTRIYLQIKGSHIALSGDTKCWNNICWAGLNLRRTFICTWGMGLYITVTCAATKSAECFNLWLVKQCEMCRGQGLRSEARVQQQFISRNKTRCFVFLAKCSVRWYSTPEHQWKNQVRDSWC